MFKGLIFRYLENYYAEFLSRMIFLVFFPSSG